MYVSSRRNMIADLSEVSSLTVSECSENFALLLDAMYSMSRDEHPVIQENNIHRLAGEKHIYGNKY